MSEPLRIALVAEGVTDYEVIQAAVASILGARPFVMPLLQPEESVAFTGAGAAGSMGSGWEGVYHWTKSLRNRANKLSADAALFAGHKLFIMHLDADVGDVDPAKQRKGLHPELEGKMPCAEKCPPPSASTDRLRALMLEWLGEPTLPSVAVFCTPSKAMEAWVVAMCCPDDREAAKGDWECRANPASRLGQQPKKERFSKCLADYQCRRGAMSKAWPQLAQRLSEAARFDKDLRAAAGAIP